MPTTEEERRAGARAAAHARWAHTDDRTSATAAARAAFLARFDREVDPAGELEPEERERRAESARRAYYAELQRRALSTRRKAQEAAALAEAAEREESEALHHVATVMGSPA